MQSIEMCVLPLRWLWLTGIKFTDVESTKPTCLHDRRDANSLSELRLTPVIQMPTASPKVNGLSVVLLLAQNTSATAAFYRDVLGLSLREEVHDGRHRHYACPLGSVYFTIQPAADLTNPSPRSGYDFLQLCFTVEDLDGFYRRIQIEGVTPLHPPRHFEGTDFLTLLDPDGRHVRVMKPWRQVH